MNKEQEIRLRYIKNILRSIIENKGLSKDLIFKWWTSLMLFYNMDRFSEDLDFNYINDNTITIIENRFDELGYNYTKQKTHFGRKYSIVYWEGDERFHCIVDLSKYLYKTKPEINLKSFWGKPLKVLNLKQNFAHKLCAFYERKKWRDVVDINFYMSKWIFPDEQILLERHNNDFKGLICLVIKELQTPYLNERLSKALDQLHYENYNLTDYKDEIITNLSKNYTNNQFTFDLNYKDKLNKWVKIIQLNDNLTLLIDWKKVNKKITEKYGIISSTDISIIYECKTEEKLFSYINNVLLNENLKIYKNNLNFI